jgi:ketosteroid isomerase-like protein
MAATLDTETTYRIIKDWLDAMGAGDGEGLMKGLADDVVWIAAPKPYLKMIPYTGVWNGPAGFAEASRLRFSTTTISHFELRDLVAQGSKAVAWVNTVSTNIETGKDFELDVSIWLELNNDGKITKVTAIFDPVPEMNAFTPDE